MLKFIGVIVLALCACPVWSAMAPKTHYMINCQGCHLADGSGQEGSVPSMKGQLHKFLAVPGGREFLVQVPGSANAPLNDAELAALLNWMLSNMSVEGGFEFPPYTEDEVKMLRKTLLVDVMNTRAALVSQFAAP